MIKRTKWVLVFSLILGLFSCIQPIEIDLPNLDEGIAVSAYLSTKKGLQEVRIKRLAPFTNNGINYPINQAEVWITDNLGQRQDFIEDPTGKGLYLPHDIDYVGETGKTYVLHIVTKDHRKIESSPQTVRVVPAIKKVYAEENIVEDAVFGTVVNGFNVMIDVDDPASKGDYYRWNWVHYEQVSYCFQYEGVPSGNSLSYATLLGISCCRPCWDIERCYNNCTNVLSDALTNGKTISRHPISRIPYCAKDYYIEIEQRSISKEAHDYWLTIDQLTTSNGSIFDHAPAALRGNMKCVSDPAQEVYGLFEVSDFKEGGFFIPRTNTSKPGLYTCAPIPLPAPVLDCAECIESPFRTRIKPRFWNR